MVRINRVYTRTGDKGETALVGGGRVAKDSLRVEAFGTVDELNSSIGVAISSNIDPELAAALQVIQQELFNLGAELATPGPGGAGPRMEARHVRKLEALIDGWNEAIEPLKSFILPGGSPGAAQLHLARTICRRAERRVIGLAREKEVGEFVVTYLNRLSDALFVMARLENSRKGAGDILWDSRAF